MDNRGDPPGGISHIISSVNMKLLVITIGGHMGFGQLLDPGPDKIWMSPIMNKFETCRAKHMDFRVAPFVPYVADTFAADAVAAAGPYGRPGLPPGQYTGYDPGVF